MITNNNGYTGADAVYHAIGKFFVTFSHLHSTAELMVVHLLNAQDPQRAWATISGGTTKPIVDSFFAMLLEIATADWSQDDKALLMQARKEIEKQISDRNRIAHDIWSLGDHPNRSLPDGSDAERIAYGRSPKRGATVKATPVTVDELAELINRNDRLRGVLRSLALVGMPGDTLKPTDVLIIEENGLAGIA